MGVSDLWVFGWGMVGVMTCQQKSPFRLEEI